MAKICDNKSVGIIIKKDNLFAIIKRKNYPVSYAFVAGHLDGGTARQMAIIETAEEASINVDELELRLEETFSNPCKRDGGSWHEWVVWEAVKWHGDLTAGSDAKEAFFVSPEELRALADKTRSFSKQIGIPINNIKQFTEAVVNTTEWKKEPGLEPVWVLILNKIGIL